MVAGSEKSCTVYYINLILGVFWKKTEWDGLVIVMPKVITPLIVWNAEVLPMLSFKGQKIYAEPSQKQYNYYRWRWECTWHYPSAFYDKYGTRRCVLTPSFCWTTRSLAPSVYRFLVKREKSHGMHGTLQIIDIRPRRTNWSIALFLDYNEVQTELEL